MDEQAGLAVLERWCRIGLQRLGAARAEIDALNVYPVPDGDTGTNLYRTFGAAVSAMEQEPAADLSAALRALSRGALLGARGSSGVILSQLLRAGAEHLATVSADGTQPETGRRLAEALVRAANAGYAAVAEPVEGTILTVARASGQAAASRAQAPNSSVQEVVRAASAAATDALARTPDQLERLRLAGVVDAGGAGLCVLLAAAEAALTGEHSRLPSSQARLAIPARTTPAARPGPAPAGDASPAGPAYEVMYLLRAEDLAVDRLRRSLGSLGDSLVVVGGSGLWNVHVHVDDPGAAIEAGLSAGAPYQIRVTHLADRTVGPQVDGRTKVASRSVVAVAAGGGLEQLFVSSGATVVAAGPRRRRSTTQLLDAIRATDASEVIVLPNRLDCIGVAEAAAQAARKAGLRVSVIPTRAQVQGLAAIAVHEPGRSFDGDVVAMSAAAGQTRHGAVTVAERDAMTSAGLCRAGDVLGVIDGDFAVVGTEPSAVATEVLERLLAGGGELVTVLTGATADPKLADVVLSQLRPQHPAVDFAAYEGGQQRYLLLVGVE